MSDARIQELQSQIGECENRIAEQLWIIEDSETRAEQARDEIQVQKDLMYDLENQLCQEPFDS